MADNGIAEAVGQNFSTIKDRTGVLHRLYPLTIRDWVELEREVGSVFDWKTIGSKMETWTYLIWLSVRKNGITRKDEHARRFKLSYDDLCDLFDISQAKAMADAVEAIFKISGMATAPKEEADSTRPTGSVESDPTTKTETEAGRS